MTEPTSTAGAVLGMGALASVLAALGLAPHALFWALIGATLGMSVASQSTRLRACIVFVCSVLSSALLARTSPRPTSTAQASPPAPRRCCSARCSTRCSAP